MVHGSTTKQTSGLVLNTRIQRGARNQEGLQSALFETQITTSKLLLQGYAKTIVHHNTLHLTSVVDIGLAGSTFSFRMTGIWPQPFGFKNVAVSNVALQLGLTPAGTLSSIGFEGTLKVKDLTGSAAVYYSVENPSKFLLSSSMNRLTVGDIIGHFLELPKEIAEIGFSSGFSAYFCTGDLKIAGKQYSRGIFFKSTFEVPFLGIRAETEVQGDVSRQLYARLSMEKNIDWGFLKVQRSFSDSGATTGPILLTDIRPYEGKFLVDTEAAVEISGFRVFEGHLKTEVDWSSHKPIFRVSIYYEFDLFEKILKIAAHRVKRAMDAVRKIDDDSKYNQDRIDYWTQYCSDATLTGYSKLWNCAESVIHIARHVTEIEAMKVAKVVALVGLNAASAVLEGLESSSKARIGWHY
ncbi:uncharacterized protein LOC134187652 isoform X2 [Corticium candelabrum]|uniref:uncharacterized protein LOC134187652 isoform X2 n=1 Tax=Corticium candelabrum TaxID=121492 RepID=UPI002E26EC80|nr:uncharacterized protein LOC134187652 isoform X2 [Corticium candelabrum]